MIYKIDLKTNSRVEFQEVTQMVRDIVRSNGAKSGICYIFVPHTTAGVTINEHADPSVVEDIRTHLEDMVPCDKKYRHLEGNSPAHIKASIMGSTATVIIEDGGPVLGTWQGVFFCEFDGPRNRHLLIKIVADEG